MTHYRNGVEFNTQVADIANIYGYTQAYIRSLAKRKVIPSLQIGRRYWFNVNQVEKALVRDNTPKIEASEAISDERNLDELLTGL